MASATHNHKVLKLLGKLYPDAHSELSFRNEFELVVAVVLSAQCTDKKVNEVTPELFKRYPDFKSLAKARLSSVEKIIRPVNYYKTKAKHLIAMSKLVHTDFKGRLPVKLEQLIKLPGVGRKTASVVQCEIGKEPALPVDTHVFRVSKRLGIATGKNVEAVEMSLRKNFPPETWRLLHHSLIFHGRRVCKAQRPLCENCKLAKVCPSCLPA